MISKKSDDTIRRMFNVLLTAERMGADKDEPEESRFIQISHTLPNKLALELTLNCLSPSLSDLTQEERQSLYIQLHDQYNCRKYK